MSYEDPTRPLADAQGSYRTLSSSQADRRTRTLTRSLPGLFREPHTCSLFRHRATYMAFASVRYAWVSVHSVRFVSTGSGEGSSLGQVLHTRFLAFVITHHIRCLCHSHFPPTASIPSYCIYISFAWTTSTSLQLDENIPSKTSPHPNITIRTPALSTSFPLEHYEADRTVTTLSIFDWRNTLVEPIRRS